MSGGTNGIHPVENLSDRQKCPEHPTKRKFATGELARAEAERRTIAAGIPIDAYLCSGCGQYHLTKSVGGDSITLPEGKFSVGEFKAQAPSHPVFTNPPELEEPESPIVPGDFDTRLRFVRAYLEEHPEPTSIELCEYLGGCTKDSLRKVMTALGYRNTKGRTARWVLDEGIDVTTVSPDPDLTPSWTGAPQHSESHRVPDEMWVDVDPQRIGHIAIGDLIATYAAAGFDVRIQIGSHA